MAASMPVPGPRRKSGAVTSCPDGHRRRGAAQPRTLDPGAEASGFDCARAPRQNRAQREGALVGGTCERTATAEIQRLRTLPASERDARGGLPQRRQARGSHHEGYEDYNPWDYMPERAHSAMQDWTDLHGLATISYLAFSPVVTFSLEQASSLAVDTAHFYNRIWTSASFVTLLESSRPAASRALRINCMSPSPPSAIISTAWSPSWIGNCSRAARRASS
jgi:hypothetical protein